MAGWLEILMGSGIWDRGLGIGDLGSRKIYLGIEKEIPPGQFVEFHQSERENFKLFAK